MLVPVLTILLPFFAITNCAFLYEGDPCVVPLTNATGKCISIHQCSYATKLLQERRDPKFCGFNGHDALVCCPVPQLLKKQEEGTLSRKMCFEYYDKKRSFFAIDIGQKAYSKEFPHMAAIGFGDNIVNILWLCGGTLISKQFILTAAHCVYSADYGPATWVRIGDLDLKNTTEDADPQDLKIIETFIHPNYKSRSHYHDIALFKLEKQVHFASYYKPACLHTEKQTPVVLGATGWGQQGLFGDQSSHLLKIDLQVVDPATCAKRYSDISRTKLENGILNEYQICAGDAEGRDTCPGDSGGPLHYWLNGTDVLVKHFVVAGITSFGKGCGGENTVGVYTRVSAYVGWIENIVWPE